MFILYLFFREIQILNDRSCENGLDPTLKYWTIYIENVINNNFRIYSMIELQFYYVVEKRKIVRLLRKSEVVFQRRKL